MANIDIDTTGNQYQQLLVALPLLTAQMQTRKPLLMKLARAGNKAALQAWLATDPLLKDTVNFVELIHENVERIRGALGDD